MERTRRLRTSNYMRDMVRENHVRIDELIYPIFVTEGEDIKHPVESMPGIYQYSLDRLPEEINRIKEAGIKAILIFGIPDHKDEVGSGAYAEDGIVPKAIRQIKKEYEELIIIADVCLCEYTSHGHCGLVKDGMILNDETLPLLAKASISYAKAGADIIAPSDMMDLRVKAIREALDEAGFVYTPIMSYSAKFASGYYGPFRDAALRTRIWRPKDIPDGPSQWTGSDARDRGRYRRRCRPYYCKTSTCLYGYYERSIHEI